MKLLLEADHALPLVQVSLMALAGSVEDPPGKEGLLRLTARLMRRTAHGLDPNTIDERLDTMGASLGSDVSHTSAGFAGSVLRRSLQPFAELLRGMVQKPALSESEFERLRRETLADLVELKDNDRALARLWFKKTLFHAHPYGRSITGTKQSVEAITLPDVRRAYQTAFHESEFALGFAGDIDSREANEIAATLTPGDHGRPRAPAPPAPAGPAHARLLIVDKPERTQTQILLGGLGTHSNDPDHTALVVANTVFGGTFTARLSQEVRAKRGWSYGAYSSLPVDRAREAFSIWTFPAAGDAAACVELQLAMLRDWVERGVTQEELDAAKHYLVRSHVFSSDTCAKRLGLDLDETALDLPPGYHRGFAERVQAVTLEAANAAVRRRIDPDHWLLVVLGTAKSIEPSLRRAVPRDTDVAVVPYDQP